MRLLKHAMLILAMLALVSTSAVAELPKGEALMDKMAEASGGEKMTAIKSMKMVGTMELTGMGVKGDMILLQKAPDKSKTEIMMHGIGTITQGFNGEVVWENNVLQGARLLEGKEAAMMKLQSDFSSNADWRKAYNSAKTTGEEDFNGQACYIVELEAKFDAQMTMLLDKTTYLPAGLKMIADTPMGKVPMEMTFEEYKEQDGVKFPSKMVQKVLTQVIEISFTEFGMNKDIDDAEFALPEAVQALVDKKKTEAAPEKI